MPKTRLLPVLILLVFASLGVSQSLLADPLSPGGAATASLTSGLGSLTYDASNTLGPAITGFTGISLINAVYKGAGGDLYFMYQIIDNSSTYDFSTLTVTSFAGFKTDVGYIDTKPTALSSNPFSLPTQTPLIYATRSPSSDGGASVAFRGSDGPLTFIRTTSDVFVIQTDATNYDSNGTFALGATEPTGSFAPVPEPGTLTLLAAGLLGLALLGSLKRKSVCSSRASA